MSTASSVPIWMTAVNAAPGSPQPKASARIRRWALLEIGRNSVRPWIRPSTTALRRSSTGANPRVSLCRMEHRHVGSTGLEVSRLGLGTMTWGRDTDEHEAREQLLRGARAVAGAGLDKRAARGDEVAELVGGL